MRTSSVSCAPLRTSVLRLLYAHVVDPACARAGLASSVSSVRAICFRRSSATRRRWRWCRWVSARRAPRHCRWCPLASRRTPRFALAARQHRFSVRQLRVVVHVLNRHVVVLVGARHLRVVEFTCAAVRRRSRRCAGHDAGSPLGGPKAPADGCAQSLADARTISIGTSSF